MKYYVSLLISFVFLLPSFAQAEDKMFCTMQYDPVCGLAFDTYATYGNSCVLASEHAIYVHPGECTKDEIETPPSSEEYKPPANCIAWFDGCNSCSRSAGGQAMCTLRACMAPEYPNKPAQGYCTAYQSATHEVQPPPAIETVDTVQGDPPRPEVLQIGVPEGSSAVSVWEQVALWIFRLFSF